MLRHRLNPAANAAREPDTGLSLIELKSVQPNPISSGDF